MLSNSVLLAADASLTDNMVISRVLAGTKEDYEILVRRYNSLLYKTAKGILSDEHDIEDAMQEAYIRGFEKLDQFRHEARFSTWLTRILINCALRSLNKSKGRNHLDIESLDCDDIVSLQETPTDPAPHVGENLKNALEGAITHLPSKYRLVFILREIEQTPISESAVILGISEENVKVRLHRAKAMLKDILKSELSALDIFEFHAVRCAEMAMRVMTQLSSSFRIGKE